MVKFAIKQARELAGLNIGKYKFIEDKSNKRR